MTGSEALAKLLDGNIRFASGQRLGRGPLQLAEMVEGQNPIAAVFCCADFRVPPEHIMDQGLGDIFVVRVVGNIAGLSRLHFREVPWGPSVS